MMICGRNEQHIGRLDEVQAFQVLSSSNTKYFPTSFGGLAAAWAVPIDAAVTVPSLGGGLSLFTAAHLNQQANARRALGTNANTLAGKPIRYERSIYVIRRRAHSASLGNDQWGMLAVWVSSR
jgi:hypothetical protein